MSSEQRALPPFALLFAGSPPQDRITAVLLLTVAGLAEQPLAGTCAVAAFTHAKPE